MGLALCLGIFLEGQGLAGQVPTYLRVTKDGVIYYYFSGRHQGGRKYNFCGNKLSRENYPRSFRSKISSQELDPLIQEVSRQYKMPPALIKALIRVESNFNPEAVSPKGAQGLMQLMPETADYLGVRNPFSIQENLWAGTRYLWMLLQKFHHRLPLALAAYNAGPKRVEKSQQVPNIPETQNFVRNVCATFLKLEGKPCLQ